MMFLSDEIDNSSDFEGVIGSYNYFSIVYRRNN